MEFCDESNPTNFFTILELLDRGIGEFYLVQEGRNTDFEAPKLRKGSSGRDARPTDPFTILEAQKPWIVEFFVVQEQRLATDLKALKL